MCMMMVVVVVVVWLKLQEQIGARRWGGEAFHFGVVVCFVWAPEELRECALSGARRRKRERREEGRRHGELN